MSNQNSSSQYKFWSLLSKKLSNEASSEELQELQSILLSNPDFHLKAEMLTEMWEQRSLNDIAGSEAVYMRHIMKHKNEFFVEENPIEIESKDTVLEKEPGFSRSFFSKKRLTIFLSLTFLIVTIGAIYLFTQKKAADLPAQQALSSIVTKNGNRTKIVLPDGSQVWLNAGSNLDYNNDVFNKHLREVTLNGEAYFDVTKNAEKPFIIHTKKMDVKVIGTAFNVRSYSYEKTAEASLIRGSIEVTLKDRKDQKITLKPNEKISIATDEVEQPISRRGKTTSIKNEVKPIPQIIVKELKQNPTNNIIAEIAWTQNKLYFEDESLENIAPMLERWFGKKVEITNVSLKNLRYYGNFEKETMEEVLSYLKLSKRFNFKIEPDSVLIY
jgi:ferric-dicitrate binding protein FerR (iron transport regulator)